MKTIHDAARDCVIETLAEDLVDSYFGDSRGRAELAQRFRAGFKGFDNMTDAELVECAEDSGLAQRQSGNVLILRSSS